MSKNEYFTNKVLSFASGRFEKGLIKGLIENGVDIRVYSIEPRNKRFPRDVFWVESRLIHNDNFTIKTIGYINIPFFKHMSIFLNLLFYIFCDKIEDTKVISYNADVPIIQVGLLLEWLGISYYPILADLPFYDIRGLTINKILSNLGYRSQIKNLKKLRNAIVLNENSAKDFGIKNFLLMEGAVTNDEILNYALKTKDNFTKRVFYCGSLDEYHGSDKILELVKLLPDVKFLVCGKGSVWSEVFQNSSKKYTNLEYYGAIDDEKLFDLQKTADLMIIPHPVELKQLRYQFPSKIMTCLASGVPVLVTPLPGITDEYKSIVIMTKSDKTEDIAEEISKFFSIEFNKRNIIARNARIFVVENKTWYKQASRIIKFIMTDSNVFEKQGNEK